MMMKTNNTVFFVIHLPTPYSNSQMCLIKDKLDNRTIVYLLLERSVIDLTCKFEAAESFCGANFDEAFTPHLLSLVIAFFQSYKLRQYGSRRAQESLKGRFK